ncbi:Adenosylmethionine-8-amino-7-oxononanoate aminotransferase [Castellaniella denitrificans]
MKTNPPDWLADGHRHVWLPYTQMKTAAPPAPVVRTQGSRIELADGRTLIDGIASWWTACHGYNHPHIARAVREQLDRMPHVMFGGLAHEPALTLARRLCALLGPGLGRVFFTESGSVSVEVALKIAMQYWFNLGEPRRRRIAAFRGGYHGDTFGTMAVCDPGVARTPPSTASSRARTCTSSPPTTPPPTPWTHGCAHTPAAWRPSWSNRWCRARAGCACTNPPCSRGCARWPTATASC